MPSPTAPPACVVHRTPHAVLKHTRRSRASIPERFKIHRPPHRPARKRIRCGPDVERWKTSAAFRDLTTFLTRLADAVQGVSVSEGQRKRPATGALASLVALLDKVKAWADEIPLLDFNAQRFGNKAFRELHKRLVDASVADMGTVLTAGGAAADKAGELAVYWTDAFGNDTRIDYGTGHELNFVMVLYCLAKLGAVEEGDEVAMVTSVFVKYMEVMRVLQERYMMEPAGSKGVWGLDDYHHLPFYFGASQLLGHQTLTPAVVEQECGRSADEYLYMAAIHWILTHKSGAFCENSPTLSSLSSLQWPKIKGGMLKMYHGEVLHQWPVVQHLCFGTLFPWPEADPSTAAAVPAPAPMPMA